MGHSIRAILGNREALQVFTNSWPNVIELPQGFGIVFMTDELLDSMAEASGDSLLCPQLSYLTIAADQFLRRASLHGGMAYLETDYFGGVGTQAGALYEYGQFRLPPQGGEGTINRLLRELGVQREAGQDEFDSLGLGRYRRMDG